jgi:hypothetical protein
MSEFKPLWFELRREVAELCASSLLGSKRQFATVDQKLFRPIEFKDGSEVGPIYDFSTACELKDRFDREAGISVQVWLIEVFVLDNDTDTSTGSLDLKSISLKILGIDLCHAIWTSVIHNYYLPMEKMGLLRSRCTHLLNENGLLDSMENVNFLINVLSDLKNSDEEYSYYRISNCMASL